MTTMEDILRMSIDGFAMEWNETKGVYAQDMVDIKVTTYLKDMLGNQYGERSVYWAQYSDGKEKDEN